MNTDTNINILLHFVGDSSQPMQLIKTVYIYSDSITVDDCFCNVTLALPWAKINNLCRTSIYSHRQFSFACDIQSKTLLNYPLNDKRMVIQLHCVVCMETRNIGLKCFHESLNTFIKFFLIIYIKRSLVLFNESEECFLLGEYFLNYR